MNLILVVSFLLSFQYYSLLGGSGDMLRQNFFEIGLKEVNLEHVHVTLAHIFCHEIQTERFLPGCFFVIWAEMLFELSVSERFGEYIIII